MCEMWWDAPVRHPKGYVEAWTGKRGPCHTSSSRDDGTALYGSRLPRINKMLMGWVFDLSWVVGLFTHQTIAWEKLWVLSVVVSAEALRTSAMERRATDWTGRCSSWTGVY